MIRIALFAACMVLAAASCPAPYRRPWAMAETASPTAEIKQAIDRALAALKKGAPSEGELLTRLRKILEPQVDFEEMGRRVLARHYLPNSDRMPEFVQLFKQLLERNYVQRVWLEEGRGVSVSYHSEAVESDGTASIRITITTAKDVNVPVVFRLHRKSARWLVYDVIIENMSLVLNYRTQFNRILASGTFDELLTRMREAIARSAEAERQKHRR